MIKSRNLQTLKVFLLYQETVSGKPNSPFKALDSNRTGSQLSALDQLQELSAITFSLLSLHRQSGIEYSHQVKIGVYHHYQRSKEPLLVSVLFDSGVANNDWPYPGCKRFRNHSHSKFSIRIAAVSVGGVLIDPDE
ncbi:hypothetical protein Tco_1337890 [Tanacetum coccineum]